MRHISVVLLAFLIACGDNERVTRLEKQNQELQEQLRAANAIQQFDLQDKCAKEGKELLADEYGGPDKDTMLLTNNNHYNKKLNRCFVAIEWHYRSTVAKNGSWINDVTFWDVQEHVKYGTISVVHEVSLQPNYHVEERVLDCRVNGNECKTMDEFNAATHSYMSE